MRNRAQLGLPCPKKARDQNAHPSTVGPVPRDLHRQVADPPVKLMVFDRKVALFPADPLDLERGYLEIAANQENAAQKLGCGSGAPVELKLY